MTLAKEGRARSAFGRAGKREGFRHGIVRDDEGVVTDGDGVKSLHGVEVGGLTRRTDSAVADSLGRQDGKCVVRRRRKICC